MDPTHFIAAKPARPGRSRSEINAFYRTHGFDAFAPIRTVKHALGLLRRPVTGAEPFVATRAAD